MENAPTWVSIVVITLALWSAPWKAVALWKSARNNHLAWFIIFSVVNTVAILEIFYIFIWANKTADKNPKK